MPLVCAAVPDLPQAWVSLIRRASAPSNLDGRFAIDEGPGWVELRPSTIKPLAFGLDSR